MKHTRRAPEKAITVDPIPRLVVSLAIPSAISLLITSCYHLTDTYFISSIGTTATAAVSINGTLEQSITMFGTFLCVGASSYIARNIGANNREKASQTLSTSFFYGLAIGFIIMVLGLLFLEPLVRFLGATPELLPYCKDYAKYVLAVAPFMIANFVTNKCLCSEGSTLFAMFGTGIGAILNVFLDPLFIFTLDLGIRGASIATAISKLISFCVLLLPYLRRRSMLRISLSRVSFPRDIVMEICRMGSPSFLRVLFTNLSAILLNRLAGGYSPAVLAGIASSNRIMILVGTFISGLGQGFQPVAGQNWGAKLFDRVRKSYWFTTLLSAGLMLVFGAVLFICAPRIMQIFTEDGPDAEMIRTGVLLIRLQCIVLPVHAWVIITTMGYNSTGKALGSAILSLSRQGICYIPMLLLLPRLWGGSGLAAAQATADALSALVALPLTVSFLKDIRRRSQPSCADAKL